MTDAAKPRMQALSHAHAVLTNRKTATMLVFGFAAGLPNVLVTGTLTAWFTDAQVDLTTIGVLSWIGLAYAFKFLWSPAVNTEAPLIGAWLGRRRGWILSCQAVIALAVLLVSQIDPATSLGLMALVAAIAAFASATQDIAIDAWRIEVSDEDAPLDLLSAVYQFGYRTASFVGGAAALFMAQLTSWPATYAIAALIMALTIFGTLAAPEPRVDAAGERAASKTAGGRTRFLAVAMTMTAWAWAALALTWFMIAAVTEVPPPDAKSFTAFYGPLIVFATVILPCAIAAWIARGGSGVMQGESPLTGGLQGIVDRLYGAIVEPMVELMSRLGLASLLVVVLILTYRITDSIWGPFAYPFYMGELAYTKIEVALASKIIGVLMTIIGVALGAWSLVALGRMASLMIGAIVAALTNLLFADLARGGAGIDAFLAFTHLNDLFLTFELDGRMARLIAAIAAENIAAGFAGAAFVAYLSSLASRLHGAVQFAVFTSLTLLVGTLGRGALGDAIKTDGYASVFEFTTLLGGVAVIVCAIEWYRQSRLPHG